MLFIMNDGIKPDAMQHNAMAAEKMLKLLANNKRLMILCHLLNDALTVGALNQKIALSQSALSQHLAKMRQDGLVQADKQGQHVYYRIAKPEVGAILNVLYEIYCKE